jgi:hypothetical protein
LKNVIDRLAFFNARLILSANLTGQTSKILMAPAN